MLVGAGRSGASKVAESITSGIHAIRIDGVAEPVLGASVGIATYPNDGETCDELLVRADEDMYRVKHKLRRTQTPKRLTTLKPVGGEERSSANNPVAKRRNVAAQRLGNDALIARRRQ
jgi:GGDEF domain-containing protein